MTITEFDIKAAKLQAKLLKELGEPVPPDVKALAEANPDAEAESGDPDGQEAPHQAGKVGDHQAGSFSVVRETLARIQREADESSAANRPLLAMHRPEVGDFTLFLDDAESFVRDDSLIFKFHHAVPQDVVALWTTPARDSVKGAESVAATKATSLDAWEAVSPEAGTDGVARQRNDGDITR